MDKVLPVEQQRVQRRVREVYTQLEAVVDSRIESLRRKQSA